MATNMKAWRLEGIGGKLSLCDVAVPEVRAGSVLVRVEASSLMSYLKAYAEGKLPSYHAPEMPFTPGGNGIGVVHAVGRDVWHLKVGQRVALSSHFAATENVRDPAQILIGVTSFGPESEAVQADWPDGTLAEYALMPVSAVTPVEGLNEFESAQLAVLSRCAVPFGGLLRGRLTAGETVIVNGATGAYGSAAVLVAIAMGAARVVAAGRNADALEAVGRAAGTRVVTVRLEGDVQADAESLRAAAGGGAQLAFDMVGQAGEPSSTLSALSALRRGGRLVVMGSMTVPLPVSYMQLMFHNLEIIGNFMYPADAYRRLIELVRGGLLDINPIVPRIFPFSALPEAMEAAAKAGNLECVVLQP
ncbi:zinc-binding dehydrogenase [Paraburkholderia sp. D1E]|uniref:zinc-binding dehydrogenase n=1 Tax=Paraburkholderia sp. D1E TaxID=3461398 RepID=UPI000F1CA94A